MATQRDVNNIKNILLGGGSDNNNPNHYRHGKTFCKSAGGDLIVSALIASGIGIVFTYAVDWLIPSVEKPRRPGKHVKNHRKF